MLPQKILRWNLELTFPTTKTAGLASGLAGRGKQDTRLEMQSEAQSLRKDLGKISHHTLPSFFLFKERMLSSRTARVHLFLPFFSLNWAVATATQEQTTHCLQWIADTHFSSTESGSELLKRVILSCCFFFLAWYQYSFSIGPWSGSTLLSWMRKICPGERGLRNFIRIQTCQPVNDTPPGSCVSLSAPTYPPGCSPVCTTISNLERLQSRAFYFYLEWPA